MTIQTDGRNADITIGNGIVMLCAFKRVQDKRNLMSVMSRSYFSNTVLVVQEIQSRVWMRRKSDDLISGYADVLIDDCWLAMCYYRVVTMRC